MAVFYYPRERVEYSAIENKFHLFNNTDTGRLGGITPGMNARIENSYMTFDCLTNPAPGRSGNTVTVKVTVIPKSAYTDRGNKSIYLRALTKPAQIPPSSIKGRG